MTDHTKTPWRNSCFQVYGSDNSKIAHTGMGQLPPYRSSESEANAMFIVKAVNNYDALTAALGEAIDVFEGMNDDEINLELLPWLRAALR